MRFKITLIIREVFALFLKDVFLKIDLKKNFTIFNKNKLLKMINVEN